MFFVKERYSPGLKSSKIVLKQQICESCWRSFKTNSHESFLTVILKYDTYDAATTKVVSDLVNNNLKLIYWFLFHGVFSTRLNKFGSTSPVRMWRFYIKSIIYYYGHIPHVEDHSSALYYCTQIPNDMSHLTPDTWHMTPDLVKDFFFFFSSSCIGASIRTRWEIQCLPYAGFFLFTLGLHYVSLKKLCKKKIWIWTPHQPCQPVHIISKILRKSFSRPQREPRPPLRRPFEEQIKK